MFNRFAHLKFPSAVRIGQILEPGDQFGFVGSTGNSTGAHSHYDIFRVKPDRWTLYPTKNWSKEDVAKVFADPTPIIQKTGWPSPNTLPDNGSKYLQWNGKVFHPGVDINSSNDDGKPLRSPTYARVVHVSTVLEALTSGFGNFIVTEDIASPDPSYDLTLAKRLAGRFLLAVEDHGRLWYVDQSGKRYSVGINPEECAVFLAKIAAAKVPLGISASDLSKIPKAP